MVIFIELQWFFVEDGQKILLQSKYRSVTSIKKWINCVRNNVSHEYKCKYTKAMHFAYAISVLPRIIAVKITMP